MSESVWKEKDLLEDPENALTDLMRFLLNDREIELGQPDCHKIVPFYFLIAVNIVLKIVNTIKLHKKA